MDARNPRGSKRNLLRQTAEPSIRSSIPERSGPSPAGRPRTTAHGVVASLTLPAARPASSQPVSPLPLTGLHRLPRDASMLYDIGRVDGSGRVASNDIINALDWRPGSKLEVILTPRTIVIRAAPDGLFSVPPRPCLIIPSHVRRPHGIKPRDHVLIAAAPDYGLVIVYPLSALDEMISRYHSAEGEAEYPQ
jgi:bifunctional DNA-binding transcriptional regulator/antitoxin component of YhaV-PrlF toxin-antitoxin module